MPQRKTPRMKTTDAEAILDRVAGDDPKLHEEVEEAKLDMRIAKMILAAREAAGLTQAQLAKLVGTQQSIISRLEDADHEERSLTMLQRIAAALHKRVEVRLVSDEPVRRGSR